MQIWWQYVDLMVKSEKSVDLMAKSVVTLHSSVDLMQNEIVDAIIQSYRLPDFSILWWASGKIDVISNCQFREVTRLTTHICQFSQLKSLAKQIQRGYQ